MNENIEKVLAILDGFRMSDEITYSAYSALHDEISLLDDLLKEQEKIVRCKDCKYWHDSIRCQLDSEGLKTPDDWFCADGERR